jgi:hypothetical protein
MRKCIVRSHPVDNPDNFWRGFVEYIVQGLKDPSGAVALEQIVSVIPKSRSSSFSPTGMIA